MIGTNETISALQKLVVSQEAFGVSLKADGIEVIIPWEFCEQIGGYMTRAAAVRKLSTSKLGG